MVVRPNFPPPSPFIRKRDMQATAIRRKSVFKIWIMPPDIFSAASQIIKISISEKPAELQQKYMLGGGGA